MFIIRNNEKLRVCPYDSNHVMLPSRYESHVRKCTLRNKSAPEICPFNATHHVEKGELRHHLVLCPDKYRVEKEIIYQQSTAITEVDKDDESTVSEETNVDIVIKKFNEEENWDLETDITKVSKLKIRPDRAAYTNKTKAARKKEREEALNEFKSTITKEDKKTELVDPIAKEIFETRLSTKNESDNSSVITSTNRTSVNQNYDFDMDDKVSTISSVTSRGRGVAFASNLKTTITNRSRSFVTNETEFDENSSVFENYNETSSTTTTRTYASFIKQSKLQDSKLFK